MSYSELGGTFAAVSILLTIAGVVVSVLMVVAVLRIWSHTAAIRRLLERNAAGPGYPPVDPYGRPPGR